MASPDQSFTIDKYSFGDVSLTQSNAKPNWHHHQARDHLHLVLVHEGPLEQPIGFPHMNKLTVKVIWRAETLELINVSDAVNQRRWYPGVPNIACMKRNPALAFKVVNLRHNTLHRLQVRFVEPGDFEKVIAALERAGCPVQLHNADSNPPNPATVTSGLLQPQGRPDTAGSMLTTAYGQPLYQQMRATVPGMGGIVHEHSAQIPSRIPLGPQALNHTPQREYFVPRGQGTSDTLPGQVSPFPHQGQPPQPIVPRNGVAGTASSNHDGRNYFGTFNNHGGSGNTPTHQRQSSTESRGAQYQGLSYRTVGANLSNPSNQLVQSREDAHGNFQRISEAFHPIRQPSFLLERSTLSSVGSRPQTETTISASAPLSRSTMTSASTLFGQSQARQTREYDVAPSQASVVQVPSSPLLRGTNLSDDDVPPPRQLPDFEKLNKVHGDKQLPTSSASLSNVFKSSKSAAVGPSLKRKASLEEPFEAAPKTTKSTGDKVVQKNPVKRAKVAVKKSATSQTAKKTKAGPPSTPPPAVSTPKKKTKQTKIILSTPPLATSTPSPSEHVLFPKVLPMGLSSSPQPNSPPIPSRVLKDKNVDASQSLTSTNRKQTSKEMTKIPSTSKADIDEDDLDENMLAEMINSDEHLKLVNKLEKVWSRMGFGLRVSASNLLGQGKKGDTKPGDGDDDKENA